MIKARRTSKPKILIDNELIWKTQYLAALAMYQAAPSAKTKRAKSNAENKYQHKQIKESLKHMFKGKCAYCESHISHIDYGDIEHFRPKSKFPKLCFTWKNLLLGCGICNDKAHKGDLFPFAAEGGPFINPVQEDPDVFFDFEYDPHTEIAIVLSKNQRGETTEKKIGLNRPDLVKHRSHIVRMMAIIAIKASQGDSDCLVEILKHCRKEAEYSAFAKALVKRFGL